MMPATATKLDLYKENKGDYVTPKKPVLLDVAPATYLTIIGKGKPGGDSFQQKLGALYNIAFTIKMANKFAGRDYALCKLEGIWWTSGASKNFATTDPDSWNWKLIIRTPDFITGDDLAAAVATALAKGKDAMVKQVKLERIEEGRCVQMLHLGEYAHERETIDAMLAFAASKGLKPYGRHHEIYLSDPRRVAPAKLRTILRSQVK
jgi:hypothetical protein